MLRIFENNIWRDYTRKSAANMTEKIALAHLNEGITKGENIVFSNISELISQPSVISMYKKLVNSLQSQLSQFERVKKFRLMPREFTLEENELTPTFKIKRKVIYQKYASLIDEMY